MSMHILVTGAAGFIGSHVARGLALRGCHVVACDSFNTFYDPALKRARVRSLLHPLGIECLPRDLSDSDAVKTLFAAHRFDAVVHLAAQAGVRHSDVAPQDCIAANLVAFHHVLRASADRGVAHFLYASSSSVYGARLTAPFHEGDRVDQPASLYAATKAANELIAHSHAHLYGIRATGLRFFSAYGPWGRPDMAYFSFAQRIRAGEPITVFGDGTQRRDFTYIDDIVDGVARLTMAPPPVATRDAAGLHAVFNLGREEPVSVLVFLETLESVLGIRAKVVWGAAHPGDVPVTSADTAKLRETVGWSPRISLREGLASFAQWLEAWSPMPAKAPAAPVPVWTVATA